LGFGWLGLEATTARAVDPFEIQVYDGTANAPGVPGLELHVNTVPSGRTSAIGPELPPDGQTHFTLEPALGVTPWWEAGAYLQTALQHDGTFGYAGSKLRSKFTLPMPEASRWRLGVNVELSILPKAYDRGRVGNELRPIVAWENERWMFAFNPIVGTALGGPDATDGPSFEPALFAKMKIEGALAVGVEYYASFGPIAHPVPWQEQEHYLYEVIDLLKFENLELNVGLGQGLTRESNKWIAKMIVGYVWGSPAGTKSPPL
jgi:hypothetical protein